MSSANRSLTSPTQADVTGGSVRIWERLHYDWSDPNRVVMKTTGSNVWGGGSGHTYTFMRQPNGATEVDVVVVREGKNVKGRVLGIADDAECRGSPKEDARASYSRS